MPDSIIYAVAMRETGAVWSGSVVRVGLPDRRDGGDVSPWQLSRAVLLDMRASRTRARTDLRYAEQIARRWLAHLFNVTHNWRTALAAYHCGLRATQTRRAQSYADQCLNLAAIYNP